MESKVIKHIWRPSFYDKFVLIFVFLGLGISLCFLHINFNSLSLSKDKLAIGTLVFKKGIAQRKAAGHMIWENVSSRSYPLYNQDSIRTGKASSALIHLNDHSEIDMDENTLLVLDIVYKETNINFARGFIRVKRENSKGKDPKLQVHSKNYVISLRKANLKLRAVESTDKLELFVHHGKALIYSPEGERYNVEKNEELSFKKGKARFRKVPITLSSPPDGYYFVSKFNRNVQKIEQTFRWKWEKNTRPKYFELSYSPNFNPVFIKKPVRGQEIKIDLPEAIYYWRLSFHSLGIRELQYTPNSKLSLIANKASLPRFESQKKDENFSHSLLRRAQTIFLK